MNTYIVTPYQVGNPAATAPQMYIDAETEEEAIAQAKKQSRLGSLPSSAFKAKLSK